MNKYQPLLNLPNECIYVWSEEHQLFFLINKQKYINFINNDNQFLNELKKKILKLSFLVIFIKSKPVYAITLKLKNNKEISGQNTKVSQNIYNEIKPLIIRVKQEKYNHEQFLTENESFLIFLNFINQKIMNQKFLIKSIKNKKVIIIKPDFLKQKELRGGFYEINQDLKRSI